MGAETKWLTTTGNVSKSGGDDDASWVAVHQRGRIDAARRDISAMDDPSPDSAVTAADLDLALTATLANSDPAGVGPALDHEVIVIGAGFAGLCVGAKLTQEGIDFKILEESDGVGGTWWANRYPGIGVDVPSPVYSFSFALNPNWSRLYAPGKELNEYAERFVDKFGFRDRIRLNARVAEVAFDSRHNLWQVKLATGKDLSCRFLIGAWGVLTVPKMPDIPGLDRFTGQIAHTARWPEDLDLTGKRVAVIGTGASSVQLVPSIAGKVEHLTVFQRTPVWVIPRVDFDVPYVIKRALRFVPGLQRPVRYMCAFGAEMVFARPVVNPGKRRLLVRGMEATGRWWIRKQVRDINLQQALTPRYGFGCKRPTMSNTYLATFNRENVDLVTAPIREVADNGIITDDGKCHQFDVLVLGTGFKLWEPGGTPPLRVHGPGNSELGLHWWENRYTAYQGVSIPGFPNLFLAGWGPYGLGGPSYLFMVETNVRHILRCLRHARRCNSTRIEVNQKAHDEAYSEIKSRQAKSVFFMNNCVGANSYYFDPHGEAPVLRPATSLEMWWRARTFPIHAYKFGANPADDPDDD